MCDYNTLKPAYTSRKHGAQPDNTNALKHGFYSCHLCQLELDDLPCLQFRLAEQKGLGKRVTCPAV